MTRLNTLILDQTKWDLIIDSMGNIGMAQPAYALAQDVASAIKLFIGELWYDTSKGIPYFQNVLGHLPPVSLFASYMEKAALTVPGVVSAQCIISKFDNRVITGQVQFIDEFGVTQNAHF